MKEQLTLMHTQIFNFRSPFPLTQSFYKRCFNSELCLVNYKMGMTYNKSS